MNLMISSVTVNTATTEMVDELCEAHLHAFQDNFMSMMGQGYLQDYYAFSIKSDYSDVFYISDDDCFSWVVLYYDPVRFMENYRGLRLNLLVQVIISVVKKPTILMGLLSALKKAFLKKEVDTKTQESYYEIAIVASKKQGKGKTRSLLQGIFGRFQLEAIGYRLEVDQGNTRAIEFYKALGFWVVSDLVRGERRMYIMELKVE